MEWSADAAEVEREADVEWDESADGERDVETRVEEDACEEEERECDEEREREAESEVEAGVLRAESGVVERVWRECVPRLDRERREAEVVEEAAEVREVAVLVREDVATVTVLVVVDGAPLVSELGVSSLPLPLRSPRPP